MTLLEQLQKLATEKNSPCVTISLNTHRTHPDNKQDEIMLKNLLEEAKERVLKEFDKREVANLLENIESVQSEIDVNHNLDSLHLFLSNDTKEIVKSGWPTNNQGVQMSENFAVRSLIKTYVRSENYLIMVLSQNGVHLYQAANDSILKEIKNDDFPFGENRHSNKNPVKMSDAEYQDNLVKEYLNEVDKALVKVHNETNLKCVVITESDNWSKLQEVADMPSVYIGHDVLDSNNTKTHQIVKQSWAIVEEHQKSIRATAISEMREAVANGKVLTDLQEIYQAAIDGRGDILLVNQEFRQAVVMNDERTFTMVDDVTTQNAIDDITSNIAWEVLSKKGTVHFTAQEELDDLGKIVLKTRY